MLLRHTTEPRQKNFIGHSSHTIVARVVSRNYIVNLDIHAVKLTHAHAVHPLATAYMYIDVHISYRDHNGIDVHISYRDHNGLSGIVSVWSPEQKEYTFH